MPTNLTPAVIALLLVPVVSWGAEPLVLRGHDGTVRCSFSPDGTTLATGSDDKTVRLWDATSGKLVKTLGVHEGGVWRVHFSPNGDTLASISADKMAILWDPVTGKSKTTLRGHTDTIRSIAFSPDGQIIATAGNDESIRLWDARSGKTLRTMQHMRKGKLTEVIWSLAFSTDGSQLVAGIGDGVGGAGMIEIWDAKSGKLLRTFDGPNNQQVWAVALSPNGKSLVSGTTLGTITVWNAANGEKMNEIATKENLRGLAYSPSGNLLALAIEREVRLLDPSTLKELKSFKGHENWVLDICFSPDGKRIASGSSDKTVRIWSLE